MSTADSTSAFAVYSGLGGKLSKSQRRRRKNKEKVKNIDAKKIDEPRTVLLENKKKRKNDDIAKNTQKSKKQKLLELNEEKTKKLSNDQVPKLPPKETHVESKKKMKPKLINSAKSKRELEICKNNGVEGKKLEKLKSGKTLKKNKKAKKGTAFMPQKIQLLTEKQVKRVVRNKVKGNKKISKVKKSEEIVEVSESNSTDILLHEESEQENEKSEGSEPELIPSTMESVFESDIVEQATSMCKSTQEIETEHQTVEKNEIRTLTFPQKQFSSRLRNSLEVGKEEFERLIAPYSCSLFFKQHWEREPLVIPSGSRNKFDHLISTKLIHTFLRNQTVMFGKHIDITSYKNGVRETHNLEGRALPHVVWDLYNHKCSVRLLCPQAAFQDVFLMNSKLQEYFGCFVGANAYLTPPNSQGFAPHYDDIEAFVLQIEGSKNWKVYKPRNKRETLPRYSSKNFNSSDLDLSKPYMEVTLTPGDLLYFPRGYVHQANATDTHSLHLTVSVYQKNAWIDLLERALPLALDKAAQEDIEFRRGLPLNFLRQAGLVYNCASSRKNLIKSVKEKILKLVKYLDIDNAVDMMGAQFVTDVLPPLLTKEEESRCVLANGLRMEENGRLKGSIEFSEETKVRFVRASSQRLIREKVISETGIVEEQLRLYYSLDNSCEYHGEEPQFLMIPEEFVASIKLLFLNYPAFTALKSLPLENLDDQARLVGDLWDRGILMTEEPLEENDVVAQSDGEEVNEEMVTDDEAVNSSLEEQNKEVNGMELNNEERLDETSELVENDGGNQTFQEYEKAISENEKFVIPYEAEEEEEEENEEVQEEEEDEEGEEINDKDEDNDSILNCSSSSSDLADTSEVVEGMDKSLQSDEDF